MNTSGRVRAWTQYLLNRVGGYRSAAISTTAGQSSDSKWDSVSTLWSSRAKDLVSQNRPSSWSESPLVCQMYMNPLISGEADVGWLEFIARKYFKSPVKSVLSLGCGGGGLERHGLALNIAASFDAFDISDGALELARELAKKEGVQRSVNYQLANLNALVLPENRYDAVFASHSVHHIEALEHYFDQVSHTLKPGHFFIVNEFVGPNQFQWTDTQIHHSQRLLDLLPEKYRQRIRGNGIKTRVDRPTIEQMNNADPTEAIRSADILPEMKKRFEIVEKIDFGGTLLHLVLDDIAGNFIDAPEDIGFMQMLFDEEQRLLANGEISSDFVLIVARNS